MVCPACGTPSTAADVNFCTSCGAKAPINQPVYAAYPQSGVPLRMTLSRVERHLQTLGILWCVFGAYRIVGGLVAMFVLRVVSLKGFGGNGLGFGMPMGPQWMSFLLPFIAVYTIVVSALALVVGYSLLTRRPWGRTMAVVVGILTLLKPLFGTVLGIYTLWVLAPGLSGDEYDAIADRS